jgi:hypothetical protein
MSFQQSARSLTYAFTAAHTVTTLPKSERVLSVSSAEPFFCVVMRHERKWTIEATWPDESVEVAETFADYFEALGWLGLEASAWVEKRLEFEPVKFRRSGSTVGNQRDDFL